LSQGPCVCVGSVCRCGCVYLYYIGICVCAGARVSVSVSASMLMYKSRSALHVSVWCVAGSARVCVVRLCLCQGREGGEGGEHTFLASNNPIGREGSRSAAPLPDQLPPQPQTWAEQKPKETAPTCKKSRAIS
jgi:hypothetical protein